MAFMGRVVRIEQGHGGNWAKFEVFAVWKGRPFRTVWVNAGSFQMCGFPFVEGRAYVVFAGDGPRRAGDDMGTSRGSGTVSLERAGDVLRFLGEGQPPEFGAVGPQPSWREDIAGSALPSWAVGLTLAGIALAVVGLLLAARRQRTAG